MSPKTKQKAEVLEATVTVEGVNKGSILAEGIWYNPSKFTEDLPNFQKGAMYRIKYTVSEYNGKTYRYMQEAIILDAKPDTKPTETKKSVSPGFKSTVDQVVESKQEIFKGLAQNRTRDFDAEARGKSRCMLFAAALQNPVVVQFFQDSEGIDMKAVISLVTELADAGMAYTFNDKPVISGTVLDASTVRDSGIPVTDGTVNEEEIDENPLVGL